MAITIYKIESPSGKIYVGQSRNLTKRKNNYKNLHCVSQHALYNSFLKYGYNSHIFSIIKEFEDNTSSEIINNSEIEYIQFYKNNGFKLLNIADGGRGGLISEETRQKLSKAQKGKKHSLETRQKMSKSRIGKTSGRKGKCASEETKKNISKGRMGISCGNQHWRTKPLINLNTNEIYQSITEASKKNKIKRTTLNAMLTNQNKNTSSIIYYDND